ncbi:histidine--tRNA ligase [Brevundimonas sp. AJA228-03]|uniref:histidine--tRNA ligase n=1 Tax=Brevundimonas sp. AJA228-03 TaxID=2752515 RepID=UPI001AE05693|nr:histidine--tRNA ligase [Brevundimonas sp. AJA228-03]QTN20032.1 histidine--tRNA ligase [Brevundimonas sp. AJA228-03]
MTDAAPLPARPEARSPRGFADRRGPGLIAERRIVQRVSEVYERWGFEPLDTGAFEYADALGKFLPDADRPNEGVFALQDDDDQWMALRYDLTAPLARFAAENWETLPKPFRRYAFGPVWRNEKPGPGRFREFTQCDADTVGSDRPEADAEIIAMACEGLQAAGLPPGQAVVRVSNRKLFDGLFEAGGVTDPAQRLTALRAIDKFDRLGWSGVAALLGEGRLDESGDYTRGANLPLGVATTIEALLGCASDGAQTRAGTLDVIARCGGLGAAGEAALEELAGIDRALGTMRVSQDAVRFDPTIVRGLEYYTGAVFEAELLLETTDDRGRPVRFGSIGGGGRYDDLVARFTGESTPATGFSFGVSRLASALRAAGRTDGATRGPVVVIVFGQDDMQAYLDAVSELRDAGIAAELYLGRAGMKAQMKYADRRGSPAVVMLGGDEIAAGQVTIKDLDAGRQLAAGVADNDVWKAERPGQITVARNALVTAIRSIIDVSSIT